MVPKLLGVTPHRAAQDLGFYDLRQPLGAHPNALCILGDVHDHHD